MPSIPFHPKIPDKYSSEKVAKKSKVHLFISLSGVDILESKTKVCYSLQKRTQLNYTSCCLWPGITCPPCLQFLLYACPLSTVSFCSILPSSPKVFGFVAQHPAADTHHCYLFQSKKFVSIPSNGFAIPAGTTVCCLSLILEKQCNEIFKPWC